MLSSEEKRLIEKIQRIEALFAGATTKGEKNAARQALARMQKKLQEKQQQDPPVECQFSLTNKWSRKLFVALLRRYGLEPYRYPRQRYTTVMVQVPASFVEETLWPEFTELDSTLTAYLDSITNRVIAESIHTDSSEGAVRKEMQCLSS